MREKSFAQQHAEANACNEHAPDEPEGYSQWHYWAQQKSRTHVQEKCRGCGLYKIWRPRAPSR